MARLFLTLSIVWLLNFNFSYAATEVASTNNPKQLNFLAISDMHVDSDPHKKTPSMELSPTHTYSGYPRINDNDPITFDKMLNIISHDIATGHLIKKPEFILILGDLSSHNHTTHEFGILRDQTTVLKLLWYYFNNIPMFYVFGNHDSLKSAEGEFYSNDVKVLERSPYEIAIHKAGWFNGFLSTGVYCQASVNQIFPCLTNENKQVGYYAAYLRPNLKLLTLNSIIFSASSDNLAPKTIADQEIAWLKSELLTAKNQNESVIIALHIPLGASLFAKNNSADCAFGYLKPKYQKQLDDLITSFKKTIVAIISGHTHYEEIKLIENKLDTVDGVIVIVPAMSTSRGNAPGIKEFALKEHTNKRWALADYTTLYFSKNKTNNITLQKLYDFLEYYCPQKNIDDIKKIGVCTNNKIFIEKAFKQYDVGNFNLIKKMLTPITNSFIILTKLKSRIKARICKYKKQVPTASKENY